MADKFTFEVKGLAQLVKRLEQYPIEVQERAAGAIESNVQQISRDQKRNAPKHIGNLAQQTNYAQDIKTRDWILFSNAEYAPFVEFGTGQKFKLQYPELASIAAQYRGKGTGTFKEFVRQMEIWVKRKGIGATYNVSTRRKNRQSGGEIKSIAYAIALNIYLYGGRPQPFFFEPYFTRRPKIISDVRKAIQGR